MSKVIALAQDYVDRLEENGISVASWRVNQPEIAIYFYVDDPHAAQQVFAGSGEFRLSQDNFRRPTANSTTKTGLGYRLVFVRPGQGGYRKL